MIFSWSGTVAHKDIENNVIQGSSKHQLIDKDSQSSCKRKYFSLWFHWHCIFAKAVRHPHIRSIIFRLNLDYLIFWFLKIHVAPSYAHIFIIIFIYAILIVSWHFLLSWSCSSSSSSLLHLGGLELMTWK